MNLQLALDRLTREECLHIIDETRESIDWIEVGTSVIKEYGMAIVREIKEKYPDKVIVTDMKTMDAGGHEAIQAFKAGADITTVMALASDLTILDSIKVAKEYGGRIMVDLLEVSNKERVKELEDLGVDLVSIHIGKDKQREGKFDVKYFSLVEGSDVEVTVAGGIDLNTISDVVEKGPDTLIVGSAITKDENPAEVAAEMKAMINKI
ncbi:3-hexulose-6-phosphate synthase [Paucisalibacillus sp. EB02]|uniref:3-hexulose-6-phosphate synthase n=1 Tax=Paucisalibacillus sp. EB02 TaxID=1347087 RepID=UPI0004B0D152|nr:3-hexulose-6-phosphate synthase [Paucisalibacillus sp. EB02]